MYCELSSKYYQLFLTKFFTNSKSEMSFLIGDICLENKFVWKRI